MLSYKNVPILRMLIFLIVFAPQTSRAQWVNTRSSTPGGSFATLGNRLYVNGGDNPIAWTSDVGNTWHDASNNFPGGEGILSIASIGNVLIAGSGPYNDPFYFSTDSGASWHPSNWNRPLGLAIFAMIEHDGYVFAGSNDGGIYRSSDSGRDWDIDTTGLVSIELYPFYGAYSFATKDSLIFAGSPQGEVYRTSDDGDHWQVVRLSPTIDLVQSVAVIGKTVIAATRSAAYRSTDLGLTWTILDTSFFHHGIRSIATSGRTLVAGVDQTIIRSDDSGVTWQPFDQGWPSGTEASSLISFGNYLFADGFWRRPISDLAGVKQTNAAPPDLPVLSFQDSRLSVTSPSLIHSVAIFDILGRTLSRVESHGTSVNMDLHGLTDGIYFVRIATDAGTSVRKIVFQKK